MENAKKEKPNNTYIGFVINKRIGMATKRMISEVLLNCI